MTIKGQIIENRRKLPLQILRGSALRWWDNDINLHQRLELQKRWFGNRNLYTLTGREIHKIWDCEVHCP